MSLAGDIKDLQSQYESAHSQGYKTTTIRTAELGMLLEHRGALLEACKTVLAYLQAGSPVIGYTKVYDLLVEGIATAEAR